MCPRGSCIKVLVTWVLFGGGRKFKIQDLVGGPLVIRGVSLKETRGFLSLFLNSFSWDVTFALSTALATEYCPTASQKQGHQAALEWEDKFNNPLKPWAQETFSFKDLIASGIVTVRRHWPKQLLHTGSCSPFGTSGVEWARQKGSALSSLRDLWGLLASG